ncbi:MAG: acetoacetate--CoA ligase [Deltaproteobacteria bacterium]|nr:acetoacetate--CoA ligase [Deltaproteobacteria bacterium]
MLLWQPTPDRIKNANVTRFMEQVKATWNVELPHFHELYTWSVREPEKFWQSVWDFCGVIASKKSSCVLENSKAMPGARWFPGSTLNFAENLLRYKDDQAALIFWGETQTRRSLSYRELHEQVARVAHGLRKLGVTKGDRVAAVMPNMPESIIGMLAATSIGAVWSSCSPDFGVSGILDRFDQITPKVLFAPDGYFFKGQVIDCLAKVGEVSASLSGLQHTIVVPYTRHTKDLSAIKNAISYETLIQDTAPALAFEQLPFDHPIYIMFSSGTTGKPKCIVHCAGGVLIEHLKELVLHTDLKRTDKIFYQTTCGWMMWNWLVSSLAVGATVLLYDGAPFHQQGKVLFDLADKEGMTIFGTNAKFVSMLEKEGLQPRRSHKLEHLHTILSTGSPLAPESFDYIYAQIKSDVCISSICGGTDIVGCFMLGSPLLPVHRGEIQTRSLGMKVEVFNERGQTVQGEKGELVCSAPFPSMPIYYWNDTDGSKYRHAYFERYPNVWHHGDYIELTRHNGVIVYGRSDTVLNPGGVRIGTSEIYRQVEKLPQIAESIVVGQDWNNDVRVVLFVKLQPGQQLDDALRESIRSVIRKNTTAFHVPKKIVAVADIPRTRSGKIVELAVRDVIHNRPVKNSEALANPEALELFKDLADLTVD